MQLSDPTTWTRELNNCIMKHCRGIDEKQTAYVRMHDDKYMRSNVHSYSNILAKTEPSPDIRDD